MSARNVCNGILLLKFHKSSNAKGDTCVNVNMTLLREQDLEMVMEWRMRPYVTKYMNTDPVLTIENQRDWFRRIKDSQTQKN